MYADGKNCLLIIDFSVWLFRLQWRIWKGTLFLLLGKDYGMLFRLIVCSGIQVSIKTSVFQDSAFVSFCFRIITDFLFGVRISISYLHVGLMILTSFLLQKTALAEVLKQYGMCLHSIGVHMCVQTVYRRNCISLTAII